GVAPGLETEMDDWMQAHPEGLEREPGDAGEDGTLPPGQPEGQELTDATPRPLYVHRKVKNAAEIIAWAKSQGFATTLPAEDMHVTIAFSRAPVDWMKVGEAWTSSENGELTVKPGG